MRSICIVSDDISSCIVMGHTGGIAFQTESYQILQIPSYLKCAFAGRCKNYIALSLLSSSSVLSLSFVLVIQVKNAELNVVSQKWNIRRNLHGAYLRVRIASVWRVYNVQCSPLLPQRPASYLKFLPHQSDVAHSTVNIWAPGGYETFYRKLRFSISPLC